VIGSPADSIPSTRGTGSKESVARFIRELGHDPIPTGNDPVLGVDFSIRDPQTGLFGIGIECGPPEHRVKALAAGIQPLKIINNEWQDVAATIHKPRERERMS
jgi:hypothetical protein